MRRRFAMRSVRIGVVLLFCISSPVAFAEEKFSRASQAIRDLIREQHLPSVVVAVAKNGRIVWEEGFGWADVEQQRPATPHTPYSLASVSKPFTATAIMKLVDAGRLVLDRPANEYLGDAKISGRDATSATVRRILSHTAGLPPFFRVFESDPPSIEEVITRYAVLTNSPGRRYVYSNLGYGILEHVIARVSGQSYEEFMHREVFLPLRLEQASVPRVALANVAIRYDARGRPMPFYDLGHRGASAIYASAHDLVRFGMFHLKEPVDDGTTILKRRSIETMQRVQTPGSSTDGYGLGWRINEDDLGFRHVSHTGGMPGVTTVLSLFPSERVVIVVLTNTRNDSIVQLARELAAFVMPQYGWRLRQARHSDRE
jgi:CubicO group peptidase (beta-lactamase class C family)